MFRLIYGGNALPASLILDPTAEFESGMIAQNKVIGNQVVCGVSDGTAPLGFIDDVKTVSFSKNQIDEVVVILAQDTEVNSNGVLVSKRDETGALEHADIVSRSFTSTVDMLLNQVNGIVIAPAGTPVNHDSNDDGVNDSIMSVISYTYRVPNQPGDDSTTGTGMITVHYGRGFYATDQFDPMQQYPVNATLYCGFDGKLTTKQPSSNHPGIAMVTGPPTSTASTLECLWL